MKDKIFGVLQRVGRAFMLPISLLPVAGFLLGIGSCFTNFSVLKEAGSIVFENLPILFAMGVAIGMAKREREIAALAAAIAFFVMHATIGSIIEIQGGAAQMQMGVFGGIIVGLGVAGLHNKFYNIELPQAVAFFGGTRFVPIISALVYVLVGGVMYFIWPPVQQVFYEIGEWILRTGYVGTWVYGFMERFLIPFGLHHVFYVPIWQTALGGTMEVQGVLVEGAQNIFFAQLADPSVGQFSVSATRFMAGKFPLMIFALPGAALAMYRTARPEKRRQVARLLISAAFTSMLTGVTEPIEFTFLFVSPVLYGLHCVFAGFSFLLMHMCSVGVGSTFSGGFIELALFGILQGNSKTNWIWVVIIGVGYFILYYVVFSYLIKKMNLKTPGRDESIEVRLYTSEDVENQMKVAKKDIAEAICNGLGGIGNISYMDSCVTRLRCTVREAALVNDELLKATGASAVVQKGNGVQIVYGPQVSIINSKIQEYMSRDGDIIICSPIDGNADDISTIPDEVFSNRIMGDGAVVTPTDGMAYAPEDGEIIFVFKTKHSVGLLTDSGVSLLIHLGIDTVELNGEGFEAFVKVGDRVKKGDPLIKMDLDFVKDFATSTMSPIVCTELKNNEKVQLLKTGKVKAGEPLFVIHKN